MTLLQAPLTRLPGGLGLGFGLGLCHWGPGRRRAPRRGWVSSSARACIKSPPGGHGEGSGLSGNLFPRAQRLYIPAPPPLHRPPATSRFRGRLRGRSSFELSAASAGCCGLWAPGSFAGRAVVPAIWAAGWAGPGRETQAETALFEAKFLSRAPRRAGSRLLLLLLNPSWWVLGTPGAPLAPCGSALPGGSPRQS